MTSSTNKLWYFDTINHRIIKAAVGPHSYQYGGRIVFDCKSCSHLPFNLLLESSMLIFFFFSRYVCMSMHVPMCIGCTGVCGCMSMSMHVSMCIGCTGVYGCMGMCVLRPHLGIRRLPWSCFTLHRGKISQSP